MSTRPGGTSAAPFDSMNLAQHVGDEPSAVVENRRRFAALAGMSAEPHWLRQVHGTDVACLDEADPARQADAAWTGTPGRICAVLTADCLPVLVCARDASVVGCAHAGWRGLAGGVLERLLGALPTPPDQLLAWLGPAISQAAFEVGHEVREAFCAADPGAAPAFVRNPRGRWQADLYALARRRLALAGVTAVYGGGRCTYAEAADFFSYRRASPCGRMASVIWLGPGDDGGR